MCSWRSRLRPPRARRSSFIELAERRGLKLMVDHTFLFTGAVRTIKRLLDAQELGHLYYYDTTRVNLDSFNMT